MIKELTINDADELEFLDPDWTTKEFEDFLGIPGATGFIDGNNFCIGIVVDDEIFVDRVIIQDKSMREEFWRLLKSRFKLVHVDLTLEKRDHPRILELYDQGFAITTNGCMRVRLTW